MKYPFYISLLLAYLCGMVACTGPVILEEEQEETENTGKGKDKSEDEQTWQPVPITHEGTYDSPYSVTEAKTLESRKGVWIEGYIVGSVSGSMKNGCDYTAEAVTASNILLADAFPIGSEYDYLYCMPVELPNSSLEREDLNLYDHPDNYHRKVRIKGDITLYYRVPGIKNITEYTFGNLSGDNNEDWDEEDNTEKEDEPKEPDQPHDPDATRQDTLSIAEGIKLQSETEYNQVYIRGYIIGYTTSNRRIYYDTTGIKTTAKTNVILADNLTEQNPDNVIAVELANDSYIQQAVSLYYKPKNLHKSLTVKGRMLPYRGLNGCIDIPQGKEEPIGSGIIIEDYYFSIE